MSEDLAHKIRVFITSKNVLKVQAEMKNNETFSEVLNRIIEKS
jgi:predicted CopG family antitoxin